ncbi:MAG: hypothetical protein KC589_05400, partial [Nanoarchaeota archaeon]|nr:hypothetical protein [Nanoarchaeota archaeon]
EKKLSKKVENIIGGDDDDVLYSEEETILSNVYSGKFLRVLILCFALLGMPVTYITLINGSLYLGFFSFLISMSMGIFSVQQSIKFYKEDNGFIIFFLKNTVLVCMTIFYFWLFFLRGTLF